jgi:REP element-mobilizing transposase RayT
MDFKREPNRLSGFDYNSAGAYFITFCTEGRVQNLSKINNTSLELSKYGNIIENYLQIFKTCYPHFIPCEHIIMPNHVHLILYRTTECSGINLSRYIAALKTLSCRDIRTAGLPDFKWQKSFYDRVIRSDMEYYNIANYILNNPSNWTKDVEYTGYKNNINSVRYYEGIFSCINDTVNK